MFKSHVTWAHIKLQQTKGEGEGLSTEMRMYVPVCSSLSSTYTILGQKMTIRREKKKSLDSVRFCFQNLLFYLNFQKRKRNGDNLQRLSQATGTGIQMRSTDV